MSILNSGPGPFPHLAHDARKLRTLADDLDRIAVGRHPTASELGAAPVLADWRVLVSEPTHLVGIVRGHPLIADGHACRTSALVTLDPAAGYARTISRFYRLAPRQPGRGVQ